jgi:hypothetical protein
MKVGGRVDAEECVAEAGEPKETGSSSISWQNPLYQSLKRSGRRGNGWRRYAAPVILHDMVVTVQPEDARDRTVSGSEDLDQLASRQCVGRIRHFETDMAGERRADEREQGSTDRQEALGIDAGQWLHRSPMSCQSRAATFAPIDREGNLMITGRSKDLIESGGERINPAEIDAVVRALPQVSFAAVVGSSDIRWGERPILLVELRGDQEISDRDLLAPLRARAASWWIPDAVVRLPAMPLAATGKIDKIDRIGLHLSHGGA